jgi:hypothetical protein
MYRITVKFMGRLVFNLSFQASKGIEPVTVSKYGVTVVVEGH